MFELQSLQVDLLLEQQPTEIERLLMDLERTVYLQSLLYHFLHILQVVLRQPLLTSLNQNKVDLEQISSELLLGLAFGQHLHKIAYLLPF